MPKRRPPPSIRHSTPDSVSLSRDDDDPGKTPLNRKEKRDNEKSPKSKKNHEKDLEKAKKQQSTRDRAREEDTTKSVPKSIVVKRGRPDSAVVHLVRDLRHVMAPWCAMKLSESKRNKIKDFIGVSSVFGVTHLLMATQTESGVYLRIAGMPAGPTLTFKVEEFTLRSDVRAAQAAPRTTLSDFAQAPVVVLNGFTADNAAKAAKNIAKEGAGQHQYDVPIKLMSTVFKNMFPAIDASEVQLSQVRRVVLFNFDPQSHTVDWRQYGIKRGDESVGGGLRPSSKILNLILPTKTTGIANNSRGKLLPDLSDKRDVADYLLGSHDQDDDQSDEEAYNAPRKKTPIVLSELGPRLKMRLIKAEEEVCTGAVLFHEYVAKSAEELNEQTKREKELQAKRRKERAEMNGVVEDHIEKTRKKKGDDEESEPADEGQAPTHGEAPQEAKCNEDMGRDVEEDMPEEEDEHDGAVGTVAHEEPVSSALKLTNKQKRLLKKKASTAAAFKAKGVAPKTRKRRHREQRPPKEGKREKFHPFSFKKLKKVTEDNEAEG
eukprot:GHVN01050781.1.p1 GENE.GHVN01050781.1~~GHVN01050781.1.p1  ORF type:complete len:546 (+),score=98.29 GHVN01050781.1:32-1669(+)